MLLKDAPSAILLSPLSSLLKQTIAVFKPIRTHQESKEAKPVTVIEHSFLYAVHMLLYSRKW